MANLYYINDNLITACGEEYADTEIETHAVSRGAALRSVRSVGQARAEQRGGRGLERCCCATCSKACGRASRTILGKE